MTWKEGHFFFPFGHLLMDVLLNQSEIGPLTIVMRFLDVYELSKNCLPVCKSFKKAAEMSYKLRDKMDEDVCKTKVCPLVSCENVLFVFLDRYDLFPDSCFTNLFFHSVKKGFPNFVNHIVHISTLRDHVKISFPILMYRRPIIPQRLTHDEILQRLTHIGENLKMQAQSVYRELVKLIISVIKMGDTDENSKTFHETLRTVTIIMTHLYDRDDYLLSNSDLKEMNSLLFRYFSETCHSSEKIMKRVDNMTVLLQVISHLEIGEAITDKEEKKKIELSIHLLTKWCVSEFEVLWEKIKSGSGKGKLDQKQTILFQIAEYWGMCSQYRERDYLVKSGYLDVLLDLAVSMMKCCTSEEMENWDPTKVATHGVFSVYGNGCHLFDGICCKTNSKHFYKKVFDEGINLLDDTENSVSIIAGLSIFCMMAEGCKEQIYRDCENIIPLVIKYLPSEENAISQSALRALASICMFLDAYQYLDFVDDFFPVLIALMKRKNFKRRNLFWLLDTILHDMDSDNKERVDEYVEELAKIVLPILKSQTEKCEDEKLLQSAIGVMDEIVQFLDADKEVLLESFKIMKKFVSHEEKLHEVRSRGIEFLSICGRQLGKERFKDYYDEVMKIIITSLKDTENGNCYVERCYHSIFNMAKISKTSIRVYLNEIVGLIMGTLHSQDGELVNVYGLENEVVNEIDTNNYQIKVNAAVIEQKVAALSCIQVLSRELTTHFSNIGKRIFGDIVELTNYFHPSIITGSCNTLISLCATFSVCDRRIYLNEQLLMMILEKLRDELLLYSKENVGKIIDGFIQNFEVLSDVRHFLIGDTSPFMETLIELFSNVLSDLNEPQDDFNEVLFDFDCDHHPLLDTIAELFGKFAKEFGDIFLKHSMKIVEFCLNKYMKCSSLEIRSCCIGLLAEILQGRLGAEEHLLSFVKIVEQNIESEYERLQRNTFYFLNMVIKSFPVQAKSVKFDKCISAITEVLKNAEEYDEGLTDNACSALARMVTIALPQKEKRTDELAARVIEYLPLKEDFEENVSVCEMVFELHKRNCPVILDNLMGIVEILKEIVDLEETGLELREKIEEFIDKVENSS